MGRCGSDNLEEAFYYKGINVYGVCVDTKGYGVGGCWEYGSG